MIKKSLTLITTVAIIAGLIVIFTVGFNFDTLTKAHEQIQIDIGAEFNNNEIKQIANDVLGTAVEVQKTGDFEDQVVISANEIQQEKIEEIVNKVNEKYGKEITASSISVKDIPATRLTDLLTPYIWSFAIATVLILVYLAIKYKKQGSIKVIAKTIALLAIVELLVFSLIALFRIPVGQNIASIVFTIYALSMLAVTRCFENKNQKMKLEAESKKK